MSDRVCSAAEQAIYFNHPSVIYPNEHLIFFFLGGGGLGWENFGGGGVGGGKRFWRYAIPPSPETLSPCFTLPTLLTLTRHDNMYATADTKP